MSPLEEKELQMKIKKSEAVIAELEFKMEERKQDLARMEEHIALQRDNISKITKRLEGEN